MRVVGIDPGTVSVDLCGLDDGRVFLDESIPTADALSRPDVILDLLRRGPPLDLVTGPSGYGLPLVRVSDATDDDFRVAYLGAEGEGGGIGGLRSLLRAMASSGLPIVLTPGVIHLPTVPEHRKVNRVDMGTADKVCAVVLAATEHMRRRGCDASDASFILLELGGAFSAAIAVDGGRIVDGLGGSSGPMGLRSSGALDGEVAYLAGVVTKRHVFSGGATHVAGLGNEGIDVLAADDSLRGRIAWASYVESAVKAIATLVVSLPKPLEVVLSGRAGRHPRVRAELTARLATVLPGAQVAGLDGFAERASQAAQGAALLADGLAGGGAHGIVDALGIRHARGTVLDHLCVITPNVARQQLGIREP